MVCRSCENKDIFQNGIGDLFISDEQKKVNESLLQSDELQRQQTELLMERYSSKKAMASSSPGIDSQTLLVLAGVGVMLVFVVIMTT